MRWEKVCIESMGWDLADRVVTSDDIEGMFPETLERLGVARGSLERICGVRERRWYAPEVLPSEVATLAAQRALDSAGIGPMDIDLLINASITRDHDEPATATLVGGNLGIGHHCGCFDLSHACMGFVTAIIQATNAIELGQARRVLVVSGENPVHPMMLDIEKLRRPECDQETFRSIFATLTLGSGAVAMVLADRKLAPEGHVVQGGVERSATEHNRLCIGDFGKGMRADTRGLIVHGSALVVEAYQLALTELGLDPKGIDRFVAHQVSMSHFSRVFEQIGQPLDKLVVTLDWLGNCASAALPLSLAIGGERGAFAKGDQIVFLAGGSGLGGIVLGVRW